jgi:hypothetical protein
VGTRTGQDGIDDSNWLGFVRQVPGENVYRGPVCLLGAVAKRTVTEPFSSSSLLGLAAGFAVGHNSCPECDTSARFLARLEVLYSEYETSVPEAKR